MAGKKLLNCFVKFKNDCGFYNYFRVIRQENNLCTLLSLNTQQKSMKIVKKVEELEKVKVLNIYLSTKEIDEMLSEKISISDPYVIRHEENDMLNKAWDLAGQQSIFHIINPKRPHIFVRSDIFTRVCTDGFTGISYEIYVDKILYTYDKND